MTSYRIHRNQTFTSVIFILAMLLFLVAFALISNESIDARDMIAPT